MIDLQNKDIHPSLEDVGDTIGNLVFMQFCSAIKERYSCTESLEFSSCSMAPGWNVKFKKAGKSLCTIYPRERYFTVMIVIGRKEKDAAEAILPETNAGLQEIYSRTKEFNGQRWLMLDLEDKDPMYDDILRLIEIRVRRRS